MAWVINEHILHVRRISACNKIDICLHENPHGNLTVVQQQCGHLEYVGVVISLPKAFDTIDHQILLNKLSYYGIKNTALKCFINYLFARAQYVEINSQKSSKIKICTEIPQGSILGPLLSSYTSMISLTVLIFLARLWGAYAIPVALSGVRRLSFVVCRTSCVVCVHHNYQK